MKTSAIIFVLVLSFSSIAFSQSLLQKGTFSLNGTISYTSNYEESSDNNSTVFIFNPRFDYFFIDNLSFGIMVNVESRHIYDITTTMWGIGPSLRFYFDANTIKPFAGLGYSYASETMPSENNVSYNSIIVNIGADYFLTNNVALETILSYTFMKANYPQTVILFSTDLERTSRILSLGIGVNVFLR